MYYDTYTSKTDHNRAIVMKTIRKMVLGKRLYKLFFLYIFVFFLYACNEFYSYSEEDLYGTWIGNKNEFNIVLSFRQDSSIELKFNKGDSKVDKIKGTFELDFSKTPIPLSIRNIANLSHPLHTIIKFKDHNTIIMGEFAPRLKLRPISFNSDSIIFTRSGNP